MPQTATVDISKDKSSIVKILLKSIYFLKPIIKSKHQHVMVRGLATSTGSNKLPNARKK